MVSQHLKYQITKTFPGGNPSSTNTTNANTTSTSTSESSLSTPSNTQAGIHVHVPIQTFSTTEMIDPKYNFSDKKINVNEEQSNVNMLHNIFEDFVNGRNITYYSIFLDFIVNNILGIYSKFRNGKQLTSDLIITELDNWRTIDKDISKHERVIYFQTTLLCEENFKNLE